MGFSSFFYNYFKECLHGHAALARAKVEASEEGDTYDVVQDLLVHSGQAARSRSHLSGMARGYRKRLEIPLKLKHKL
jgi:hypothetical protein